MVGTAYVALNYMKYNAHYWYAAVTAGVICSVTLCIFLNVIQFEVYNRTNTCHPYFYQSDACRRLISETIAADPKFKNLKANFSQTVYNKPYALSQKVSQVSRDLSGKDDTLVGTLRNLGDVLQNLQSTYLGKFQNMAKAPTPASSPSAPDKPSVLSQLQTLLGQTVVDPAMAKYVAPLQRLVTAIAPAPVAPAPAVPTN